MESNQLWFIISFFVLLGSFLFIKRKSLAVEWLIYPVVYFAMLRTEWGLKAMDAIANRLRAPLKALGYAGTCFGFVGMGFIMFAIVKSLLDALLVDGAATTVGVVQPFAQNIPGTIFVPFIYFIISIFIIATTHEFAHGVMARVHDCKVKSSGFAFLGFIVPIIPAAFVEPDEKEMGSKSTMKQLSILSAGAVTNVLTAILVLIFLGLVATPVVESMVDSLGVEVVSFSKESAAEASGMKVGELITNLDDRTITNSKDLMDALKNYTAGQTVQVTTNASTYAVTLAKHPTKDDKPVLGVKVTPRFITSEAAKVKYGEYIPAFVLWLGGLLFWLFNLSLGIGLFNLVPMGPVDGGKMLFLTLDSLFEHNKAHLIWKSISIFTLAAILGNIGLAFVG